MEDQLETLKKIVRIQDIRKSMDHGQIVTYRFAVLGLLLNNEALDRNLRLYIKKVERRHERKPQVLCLLASLFYISYNNIRIDNRYLSRRMVKKFLYRYRNINYAALV